MEGEVPEDPISTPQAESGETNDNEMSRLFYLAQTLEHMNVQNVRGGGNRICIIRRTFFLWKEWLRCF